MTWLPRDDIVSSAAMTARSGSPRMRNATHIETAWQSRNTTKPTRWSSTSQAYMGTRLLFGVPKTIIPDCAASRQPGSDMERRGSHPPVSCRALGREVRCGRSRPPRDAVRYLIGAPSAPITYHLSLRPWPFTSPAAASAAK